MTFQQQCNKVIDMASGAASAFVRRVTQSWKFTLGLSLLLVAASVGFLVYALQEPSRAASPSDALTPLTVPTSTANRAPRALDGVLVDASSTALMPIAVMVENSADAWPLQGPAKANLVFEAPVEGSITRLMLVFDASSTVEEVGPVRSARPYYVEWADALDAMYVHVGGSPEGLDRIVTLARTGFRDLNEFWNGWAFWRAAHRSAPHNVFTRTELLLKAAERKTFVAADEAQAFTSWLYTDPTSSTPRAITTERIRVPYEGLYASEWVYDAAANEYVRYRNGNIVTDADGTAVRTKNVVLMLTEATVLDSYGRLKIRTTGKGKALVFQHGEKHEATWQRAAGEHLRFLTVDGLDVPFARGTTWISVLTNAETFATLP